MIQIKEEIVIDGQEYILKSKFNEVIEKKETTTFKMLCSEANLMDEANIMALGSVKIGKGFVATKISVKYLERAIKVMKILSLNKDGLDAVTLAWANDYPAIIGGINQDGEMNGIMIAPRIEV